MNIHEYQGKSILKSYGVSIQEGILAETPEQAVDAAKELKQKYNSDWVVVKAQIHAGGRGKGGGVKLAKSLDEVKEKLSMSRLAFQSEVQKELAEVKGELSRQLQSSKAAEDRVKRTLIRSPVAGTVKQMLVDTIGGVIRPGMDIVEIVPNEDKLLVEARVRPADIAFITPGQSANVKVTAYDFAIHGGLEGSVVQISPDTIVDEEGNSYYLVRVETVAAYLGDSAHPLPIIPGMVVSVDILTGEKTVLDYLLKPILKTKQLALRER